MSTKSELLEEAREVFGIKQRDERPARTFLARQPWLLKTELGSVMYTDFAREAIYTEISLPSLKRPDFIRREWAPSSGWLWEFVEIERPGICPLNKDGSYSRQLNKALKQVHEWQDYAGRNPAVMRDLFPGFAPPLLGRIIVGRSELMDTDQRALWQVIRRADRDITARTYTWLIERLSDLPEEVIERALLEGPAKKRAALASERQGLAVSHQQLDRTLCDQPVATLEIIMRLAEKLLSLAESGEFPRGLATAFESLVKRGLPALADRAREIREIIHDLDAREPNVRVDGLLRRLREFIAFLKNREAGERA